MSKKNKKNQNAGSETVQEEKVLSDDIGNAEEAEENMDEIIEDIVTEESDAGTEDVAAVEETPAAAPEETAAPEAEEAPAAEKTAEAQETAPEIESGSNNVGTVTRPVNFRTGPGFGKASIMELKPGTKVIVSGSAEGDKGTWYKCEFDGRTGYVKATGIIIAK